MGGGPPGMGGGPMRGGGPGGPGGPGPGMGGRSMGPPPPNANGGGPAGGSMNSMNGRSYSANNPPGGPFGQGGRASGGGGLGAIASEIRTPMDKYGNPRSPERPARRPGGGYVGGPESGPPTNWPTGYGDRYNDNGPRGVGRGSYNENRAGPGPNPPRPGGAAAPPGGAGGPPARGGSATMGGRTNNLRYEERDYGEYVTNLRSMGRRPDENRRPGPGGGGADYLEMEEELERLRKENDLLKRSCRDLLNNFNELSNRLFDVDESLKKVAKVFPDEEEMESLEWLLRR